ncbi:MAG TPA: pyruvate dehydrogenase (acetyl-transferring), homodimeric type [Thermoanaerobaculia bacterium]|jgi:pyruvate dehydrogenase E1 component|nr:pyruvate dehydrogenase (acetyl-transferring), homodimeric type [Thermoanaerobaculia bacterium]
MSKSYQAPLNWYTGGGADTDVNETEEWLTAFEQVVEIEGRERAQFLLKKLLEKGYEKDVTLPFTGNTPYINTIPKSQEPPYTGDRALERRIKSIVRWNAMALVVRANKKYPGLGGHISTFASSATLYQVGFHHFFRGRGESGFDGDMVYFQGHGSPGIYAHAFLEGRIKVEQMEAFRRELAPGGGLASYPHPWLMPGFWEFPTVSMGLGPIAAIYQAKFNRYLRSRGLRDPQHRKVWAFLGDGETDEPEALGAITLASREKLDNLIFVINCNLQRLDGPVRGNGKIIQELETAFRGAGWNVIKVIWGSDWDPLIEADNTGLLIQRMNEALDGEYQKYVVEPGSYVRKEFFGKYPELAELVKNYSDEELRNLRRGGHDPVKVHAAFKAAIEHEGSPTVILAKTVKGYGLGEAGEGKNVTHQQKKLTDDELRFFRDRFEIPIADKDLHEAPFYCPPENSQEIQYLRERRQVLGGPVPVRRVRTEPVTTPNGDTWSRFFEGVDRDVSTTMVFVQMLTQLLKDKEIGKRIVPIVPDEARTFGMESLFRQFGIYSHVGQLYEPVDKSMLLYYREATDGQILEEGITEAGSVASFIAAGSSYATHGIDMIPFFIFYSMFGFQRIGDLIWAAADQRTRGFLLGATSGRTTLNGEGLQHEDGHSHVLASVVPNLLAYDPAFAFELAVIIRDGLKRMFTDREDIFYYITLYNENYPMPPMPAGAEEGILKGVYKLKPAAEGDENRPRIHLLGSGSLLREALRAQEILAERFGVAADVWSATSYKELRRDALEADRWNLLHPDQESRKPYVVQIFEGDDRPIVAVTDYMKLVPDMISRWLPGRLLSLGTDGFGRSDTREALRRFFEVDAECVVVAALWQLAQRGSVDRCLVKRAIGELGVDPAKLDPLIS